MESDWDEARQRFASLCEVELILTKANRDPREISRARARGLVASLIEVATLTGHEGISGQTRDDLVAQLVPFLGKPPLAPFDWITNVLVGMAKKVGTYRARRERRALTDASYGAAGDVVLYQRDGSDIREFIQRQIEAVPGDVIVFAHSLGGIAMVDLLAMEDLSAKVKGLVTIGTQAGFLYEIDALRSLRCNQDCSSVRLSHTPPRPISIPYFSI
jgi:hypothetical protein